MGAPDSNETGKFPALLKQFLPEIQRALPQHLNADRMSRIALTAFRRTPKLGNCDPRSVFAAVIQASQLGLEPDTLGRAFLIPYGNECQFVPGWKGLVDLLNRAGTATAWTGAVFAGDEFDYALGDSPYVKHKPMGESDPEKLTHVYAIGRAKGSDYPIIEVWPTARVVKHRDRYNKVGKKHYSYGQWEMYARKVVLLQVLKYLPASAELQQAIALNDAAEIGHQGLMVADAIEGTWVPAPNDESVPEQSVEMPSSKSSGKPPITAAETSSTTHEQANGACAKEHGESGHENTGNNKPIMEGPLKTLRRMLVQNGVTEDALCLRFSVNRLEDLGMGQVNDAIKFAQGASE